MKISEIIGSRVLALGDARICGTVCGALMNAKRDRIKAFEVFTEDDDDCEKKYLDVRRVRAVSDGTLTIADADALVFAATDLLPCPVNLPAYDEKGVSLGNITDMETDDKFAVLSFVTENGAFAKSEVLSSSDELYVFRLPGSNTRVAKKKKRVPAPVGKEDGVVKAQVIEISRYAYLRGKTLTGDVELSGETIARKGDTVTDDMIETAKRRGAIVRLAMNAV